MLSELPTTGTTANAHYSVIFGFPPVLRSRYHRTNASLAKRKFLFETCPFCMQWLFLFLLRRSIGPLYFHFQSLSHHAAMWILCWIQGCHLVLGSLKRDIRLWSGFQPLCLLLYSLPLPSAHEFLSLVPTVASIGHRFHWYLCKSQDVLLLFDL